MILRLNVFIVFALLAFPAFAQRPPRPFFMPLAGAGISGQLYAEAGIVHGYNFGPSLHMDCYDCPPIYPFRGCTSISAEYYFGRNQTLAPKLGLWAWKAEKEWLFLGISGLYAFDLETGKSAPVIRPGIGVQLHSKSYSNQDVAPWREVLVLKLEVGYNYVYAEPEILAPWQASVIIYQSEGRKERKRRF